MSRGFFSIIRIEFIGLRNYEHIKGRDRMIETINKLSSYLKTLPEGRHEIPFNEIEEAIGLKLPDQAENNSWWQRFLILSNSDIEFIRFYCYRSILHVDIITQLPNYRRLLISKEVFLERWSLSNQEDAFPFFLTRLVNECTDFFNVISAEPEYVKLFCTLLGKKLPKWNGDYSVVISKSVAECKDINELALILQNVFMLFAHFENFEGMKALKQLILKVLDITSNPPFFLDTDIVNGEINIYNSGAEFLDEELVNYCLHWLSKYPEVRTLFSKALKNYSKDNITDVDARSVYDDLRASLEKLIKLILENTKSLEKNKNDIERWLVEKGTHSNVVNTFKYIMNQYIEFMNDAKHVNKYNANDLEFMVYQTAIMMRLLLEKEQA